MSNTVTQAVELIYKMDNDELNEVIEAVKLKRTYLAREVTRAVRVGDTVAFEGRGGRTETGTVTKVNKKTLIVRTATTQWRVTASLCRKVETA